MVGDAKQSIYRFRGASSFNMSRFGREDFPGAVRDSLEVNYRSTKEVVHAFSTFATGTRRRCRGIVRLLADKPDPALVAVHRWRLLADGRKCAGGEHLHAGRVCACRAGIDRSRAAQR